ncbi:hypothetical protein DL765_008817 [Monosporascus sp. GIB2]|nr:hypothetical protein DL765_008817 [Monosporascus sp. GIB2]
MSQRRSPEGHGSASPAPPACALAYHPARGKEPDADADANQYNPVRRTADDIVHFVRELGERQLGDFCLSIGGAFVFSSTVTFLLRCALVAENNDNHRGQGGLAQSTSLRLAWDLGNLCLAQHCEVVERLMATAEASDSLLAVPSHDDIGIGIPDASFIGEMFPSLWVHFLTIAAGT